jgi:glycosyltransferase involved in cell wall biosynthesis
MKILFISQYFPPEMGAPAARTYELAREWVRAGHKVTVLTAFPHHPTGIVPDEYRGKVFLREKIDGIDLVRTYVYAVPNEGFLKRVLSYLSFMASAIFFSLFMSDRSQVIVATSPQFFVALAGYVVSTIRRKPFVFEVRDLWPDSIVAVGALTNPRVISLLTRLEYFLYRKADLIVGVAESTREILTQNGIPGKKMIIVPNGVDTALFDGCESGDDIRTVHGLHGKFVVSYIGTHGMAHALETVLDTAKLIEGIPDIHFLFVGEGARKASLVDYKDRLGLTNVTFLGQQDRASIPAFLAASDVSLVSLRNAPLFSAVLPSKMFEIMAAERPIILGVRGEAMALLGRAEAGLCVEPENPDQYRDAIVKLFEDRDLGYKMGANGRKFVTEGFTRSRLAARYVSSLEAFV